MAESFKHIGPRVEPGDIRISSDDAERFRVAALQGTRIADLRVTDTRTEIAVTSYASGMISSVAEAAADYRVAERAFISKSTYDSELAPYWRTRVRFARFNLENRDTKIYNDYTIEEFDGTIMSAVRQVRVLRNLTRVAIGVDGEPYMDVLDRERKVFETPIEPEDIEKIETDIRRITQRQSVMSRNRQP